MAALARGAWHWYQRQCNARPIPTQVVSSGLLWATGDCLAQQVDLSMNRQRRRSEQREREGNGKDLHSSSLLNTGQVRYQIQSRIFNFHFDLRVSAVLDRGTSQGLASPPSVAFSVSESSEEQFTVWVLWMP